MNEPLRKLRADKRSGPDQVRNPEITQGAHHMASFVRAYYLALIAQGFDEEQALSLTQTYQATTQTLAASKEQSSE